MNDRTYINTSNFKAILNNKCCDDVNVSFIYLNPFTLIIVERVQCDSNTLKSDSLFQVLSLPGNGIGFNKWTQNQ